MKKHFFLLVATIAILLFHYQTFAQQTGKTGFKTEIKSEKIVSFLDNSPYVCNYETIPIEHHLFITAEYNTGIKQESEEVQLDYSIKKYVDIATSEVKQIYGADAILTLKTQVKDNENGEIVIVVTGIPIKWTSYKPIADYNREKSSTKHKTGIHKTDALGVDIGIGALVFKKEEVRVYDPYSGSGATYEIKRGYPVFAVGIRYMHHFNPYFGADFMKINFNCPFRAVRNAGFMNLQFMTGIRGNTPHFFKTMSGYGAVRMGYGFHFNWDGGELLKKEEIMHGIAFETEVGLNLSSSVFIAFSYNLMSSFVDVFYSSGYYHQSQYQYTANINYHTYALRLGFNF